MSSTIESKGRSVEEAISEALLKMGLRRDEVDVTVLQQPKAGFLGIGGKRAVVRVEKKGGGDRRGGRGHRDDEQRREPRGERRQDRGQQQRGQGRDRPREQQPKDRPRAEAAPERKRPLVTDTPVRTDRDAADTEGGRGSSRRRRRRPNRRRDEDAPMERSAEAPPVAKLEPPVAAPMTRPPEIVPAAPIVREPAPEPVEAAAPPAVEPAAAGTAPAAVVLVEGRAVDRVKPYPRPPDQPAAAFLQTVTVDLMRYAGFPCRCEVREGEYDLVKLVTDDRSAGVLIGRFGSSVDAIEHLVEKMASQAVGDRVKMNLDINNYRRRREEQLVQVARQVVQEVRSTGQPVHLDPLCARERRVIHLQILEVPGLATYTVADEHGKHVVVAPEAHVKEAAATSSAEDMTADDESTPEAGRAGAADGHDRV